MRFVWILMGVVGIWMLASAATTDGLLPSGHGMGRTSEVVTGLVLIAYSGFRLYRISKN